MSTEGMHKGWAVRVATVFAVVGIMGALPAIAAAGPTDVQYEDTADQVTELVQAESGGGDPNASGGDPAAVSGSDPAAGTLPFTGLDVAVTIGIALVLIASGLALRRLSTAQARR